LQWNDESSIPSYIATEGSVDQLSNC
jgi:hypothetical protein